MRSALNKDFIRDILNSKGRFFSIVAIVALGVAFFSGIKVTPLVMEKTSDKYYDDYNLMDIRLLSTLGLNEEDVNAIEKIEGVEGIFPTYSVDVISSYDGNENVLKVHGLDSTNLNDKNYINQLKVVEGRLPNKSGECVLEYQKTKFLDYPIGSTINLTTGNDTKLEEYLSQPNYTVVGYVETPYYLSHEKGNSSIGSGIIEGAIMVPQSDFTMEVYTDIFLTVSEVLDLNSYSDKYFEKVDVVTGTLEDIKSERELARYEEVIGGANEEIEKAEKELEEGREELEEGKKEYQDSKAEVEKELKNAQNQIDSALIEIQNGEKELKTQKESAYNQITEGEKELELAETQLKEGEAKFEEALAEFNIQKESALAEINKGEESLNGLLGQINIIKESNKSIEEQLENTEISSEEKLALETQLLQNKAIIGSLETAYEEGMESITEGRNQLESGQTELDKQKVILEESKAKIATEKENLILAKATLDTEFAKAEKELATGKSQLSKAHTELNKNKVKAENELAKAAQDIEKGEKEIQKGERELANAKEDLANLETPTWYVLDRNSHQSYAEYKGCAESIDALAKVFPIFFFAVAALVCLTTMTRMVDEQRINIGTLKGLGYKTSQISRKYILYALVACLLGSGIGIAVGFTVFPFIIVTAYGMMYTIPGLFLVFSYPIAIGITAVALAIITLSAYLACHKELKETPSVLMRPKAPKNGKRILLERMPFIWNKLSFISKVTVRNIFRYKRRFLMTVLGISGCTALILTGFGIKDSLGTIITGQYGELFKYDMLVITKSNLLEEEIEELQSKFNEDKEVKKSGVFSYQNGDLKVNKVTKEITIVVPNDLKTMDEFINLRNRKTKEEINLSDNGVVLTEKIARDMDVKVGDEIELINSNDRKVTVTVEGITENYMSHYAYMSPNNYRNLFKERLDYNRVLGVVANKDLKAEDE